MPRTRTGYPTAASRRWPAAEWIRGDGRYASVAYCRTTTVALYPTENGAAKAREFIDRCGCGGACRRQHEVVDLEGQPKITWLPRPGDRMVLLSCTGKPCGEWLVEFTRDVEPHEVTVTLVPIPPTDPRPAQE